MAQTEKILMRRKRGDLSKGERNERSFSALSRTRAGDADVKVVPTLAELMFG